MCWFEPLHLHHFDHWSNLGLCTCEGFCIGDKENGPVLMTGPFILPFDFQILPQQSGTSGAYFIKQHFEKPLLV